MTPELAPITPPVPVFPWPPWMVLAAALAALLVLALLLRSMARFIRNRPKAPPPTPREIALAALEALRGKVEMTEPYFFSIEVSDVLREFASAEFHLRATRQTSPEFLASIAARFSETDRALLAAFLDKADQIKFARVHATAADSGRLLEQALRFVKGGERESV